jgi:microcystin-dependent protein
LHDLGETGGSETVSLLESEIPAHSHAMRDHDIDLGELNAPANNRSLAQSANSTAYAAAANLVAMSASTLTPAGGDQPHNNMQPYLTFYFCIALQGVFPPRT